MPAEVISLLSSSPVLPSAAKQTDIDLPHEPLHSDIRDTVDRETGRRTINSPSRTSTKPVAGTKRGTSKQIRDEVVDTHTHDRSLFLSDDFDTTGDVDTSIAKKPRTSVHLSHHKKTRDGSTSPQDINFATARPSRPGRPQQGNTKRWNNIIEDIEFSSSPANPVAANTTKQTLLVLSDPFASPQGECVSTSRPHKSAPIDLFSGVSNGLSKNGVEAAKARLASTSMQERTKSDKGAERPSKATFIDISSDSIDSPPRQMHPPNHLGGRLGVTWDPISSSAPSTHDIQDLLSSPPVAAAGKQFPQNRATAISNPSDSDDLPDLDDFNFSKSRGTKPSSKASTHLIAPASKRPLKKASKSIEEKERERKQQTEAREVEKAKRHTEKLRAREERAVQKEKEKALAEVNKLRTDKKVSSTEMIVDIPATISPGLKLQIEAFLGDLNIQHEIWDSTIKHVVKWRRKINSRFDEDMGLWKPIPIHVKDEYHVLVIVQAQEFVDFVLGEEGRDLEAHVLNMKRAFPSNKVIYLIEGLTPWMRKNRNLLNRQFASAVRNLGTGTEPGPSHVQPRRNNNQPKEYIDEDKIEDALLSLQVLHGTLVHHTNAPVETAQWVSVFTQHISTIPYRKARDAGADAGFCMESGQVRTGDNSRDTYVQMLEKIPRVTTPIAYGIVAKYESVTDLIRGLETEGPLALAECRKGANKDGALTDRTIGQATSKRIHKIFLSRDPASLDI